MRVKDPKRYPGILLKMHDYSRIYSLLIVPLLKKIVSGIWT